MVEVGGDTDRDFRMLFSKLTDTLKSKNENKISKCQWEGCPGKENSVDWVEADQLYLHVTGPAQQFFEWGG